MIWFMPHVEREKALSIQPDRLAFRRMPPHVHLCFCCKTMLVMFSAIRCLRYRLYVNITVYATQIKILRERILAQTKILLGYSIYEEPLKKT